MAGDASRTKSSGRDSGPPKVVVIDDSEIVLEATRHMLERAGLRVVTCASPIGAALIVSREQPDLVLVDLDMASMSGERVVAAIKNGPRTAKLAVYLFSDRRVPELTAAAARSGADGFIRKEGDANALMRSIRKALGG